jgi:phosphoribosylformylglycinamidine synthase
MTQQYGDQKVLSPGTVIISAAAEVSDVRKVVTPVLDTKNGYPLYHIDFSFDALKLGGSAFAQSLNRVGDEAPSVQNPDYFKDAFEAIQYGIKKGWIVAGHDISAGGMLTALLEMCFPNREGGLDLCLDAFHEKDLVKLLFAENPGVLIQIAQPKKMEQYLNEQGIAFACLGVPTAERIFVIKKGQQAIRFDVDVLRQVWFSTSYELDKKQTNPVCARARFEQYGKQPLVFSFKSSFTGRLNAYGISPDRTGRTGVKAAIIREKGVNGDREMAYSLYLAGFDVKDVHMTDLMSGRETLEDIGLIVFVGGFSNSDVLGSAKGWAGGFLFNEKAHASLDAFFARRDTLSLGICNGCQCMVELGLIYPEHEQKPSMLPNESQKFESEFVTLDITENHSVMLSTLAGSKLGVGSLTERVASACLMRSLFIIFRLNIIIRAIRLTPMAQTLLLPQSVRLTEDIWL